MDPNSKYEKAINYLIGQVMKKTNGLADPVSIRKIIEELIEKELNGK